MSRDVSSSRAAGRALNARNAVAFDCVHPLAECVRRLNGMAGERAPAVVRANTEAVELEWNAVRFEGHWTAEGARLEGTMAPNGGMGALAAFFIVVALLVLLGVKLGLDSQWQGMSAWIFAAPVLLIAVGLPLLVSGLGSARVAAEIELVRFIGLAIGDAQKYAVHWRKLRDD